MTEEEKGLLERIKKKMDLANRFRLAFLFIAVIILVLIFWGDKFFEGAAWFEAFTARSYMIASWDLIFMLVTTFLKLFFAMRYNRTLRKIRGEG